MHLRTLFLVDLAELGEVTCEEKEDRGEKNEGTIFGAGSRGRGMGTVRPVDSVVTRMQYAGNKGR